MIRVFANSLHKLPRGVRYSLGRGIKHLPAFPGKVHLYTWTAKPSEYYVGEAFIYDPAQPTIFTSDQANGVLQSEFKNNLTVNGIYQKDFAKVETAEELKQMQYIDLHHFMLNDILQKADKISMAHSLELRVPFLDRKVAELANSIPSHMLLNPNGSKWVFRKAAEKHLPADFANRPKLGFPVPVKTWLREAKYCDRVRALFEEDWVADLFDQKKILQLLQDNFDEKIDGRRQIWVLYTFLLWYKMYFIDWEGTVKKYGHVQPDVAKLMASGKLV